MTEPTVTLDDYTRETDARNKGDIFEKLVVWALERRYRRKIIAERNLGSGTIFDGLATLNGRPLIVEIKYRKRITSLRDGNTPQQLPLQLEMTIGNEGLYELLIGPHTTLGPMLLAELEDTERRHSLRWKISEFDPARGTFKILHQSKRQ